MESPHTTKIPDTVETPFGVTITGVVVAGELGDIKVSATNLASLSDVRAVLEAAFELSTEVPQNG
jgi:hypothetical protein